MQKVKLFMRQVGAPDAALGVVSTEELETELEYKYMTQGYELFETHYLGEVRNEHGAIGYKVLFVLVRGEENTEGLVTAKAKRRESLKDA